MANQAVIEASYPKPADRSSPIFWIKLRKKDGTQERLDLSSRVKLLEISEGPSSRKKIMDQLTLHIHDFDFSEFDDPLWTHGNVLEVCWGYPGVMSRPRRFMIKTIEVQKDELRVLAQGGIALDKNGAPIGMPFMDQVKRRRTWKNKRISEIVRTIAAENGFGDDSVEVDDTEHVWPFLPQPGVTDAKFLKQLRDRLHDWVLYVDPGGILHFHEPRYDQHPLRTLYWFTDKYRGDIFSIAFEQMHHNRSGAVTTAGFDPMKRAGKTKGKGHKEETGSNTETQRDGAAATIITSGATEQVTGIVRESAKHVAGKDRKEKTKGMYRAAARGSTILKITIVGDPSIEAKRMIDLRGVGKKLSGKYYVKHVVHKVESGSGYGTVLECSRDGHGGSGTKSKAKQNKKDEQAGRLNQVEITASSATTQATSLTHPGERPDLPPTREPGTKRNRHVRYEDSRAGSSGSGSRRTSTGNLRSSTTRR